MGEASSWLERSVDDSCLRNASPGRNAKRTGRACARYKSRSRAQCPTSWLERVIREGSAKKRRTRQRWRAARRPAGDPRRRSAAATIPETLVRRCVASAEGRGGLAEGARPRREPAEDRLRCISLGACANNAASSWPRPSILLLASFAAHAVLRFCFIINQSIAQCTHAPR